MPIWSPTNNLYKYVTDKVSNKLIYEGWTEKLEAEDSDSVWLISRTTINGTITRTEYADSGSAAAWSDRASLFPAASFDNEYSVQLDGLGGRVSFGNEFNYNVSNQWSFSVWFKVDNLATQRCIYSKTTADVSVYGWGFYIRPDGKIFMQIRGPSGSPNHMSTQTFQAGVWNHLVFTFNGGSNQNGARLYFNGEVDTTPASAGLGNVLYDQTAMIGSRNGSFNFSGFIDEFSIWNKELSAADVAELYNNGVPLNATNHSSSNNITNYYRLGDGDVGSTALDNKGSVNGVLNSGAVFAEDAP